VNKKGNRNLGKTYECKATLTPEDYFHIHRYDMRMKLLKLIKEAKQKEIDETIVWGLETALKLMSIPDSIANNVMYFERVKNDLCSELSSLWS